MESDLNRLVELESLQATVRELLQRTVPTLTWFASRFTEGTGIPRNTWRLLDRPLPLETDTLGIAFDVWHAVLRAEQALRVPSPEAAATLQRTAQALKTKLEESTRVPQRLSRTPRSGPAAEFTAELGSFAHRLSADPIYGTLSILTCASVLRSEVFPDRSSSTPSYLVGHILFAELELAQSQARSHAQTGIGDRAPRLAPVANAVHSVMLFVEHLRERAAVLGFIADDLNAIKDVWNGARDLSEVAPQAVSNAVDGYLRPLAARTAAHCRRLESLILLTRPFANGWQTALEPASGQADLLRVEEFVETLRGAWIASMPTDMDSSTEDQRNAHAVASFFAEKLGATVDEIHSTLVQLLSEEGDLDATKRTQAAETLNQSLKRLAALHVGHGRSDDQGADSAADPSIRDGARYQFVNELVSIVVDHGIERLQAYLKPFGAPFDSDHLDSLVQLTAALGGHPVGISLIEWWGNLAKCYAYSRETVARTHEWQDPRQGLGWLDLRQRSYLALCEMCAKLDALLRIKDGVSKPEEEVLTEVPKILREAARRLDEVAAQILSLLKRHTSWCRSRGQQILLSLQTDGAAKADPHELVAGLFIADRIGEPWPDALEKRACEVVAQFQRADGGFPAVEPLCKYRGFSFFTSSAGSIALAGRYAARGGLTPGARDLRDRIQRWGKILEHGARFLIDHVVGRGGGDLVGWHSDRYPEGERIDCLVTTEAVTALCRIHDALRWLLNFEVFRDFHTRWPDPAAQTALPIDCGRKKDQVALQTRRVIRALWRRTTPYVSSEQPMEPSPKCSLMFYGPPGTGKTYAQELIAGELRWPLLTITIGDFLKEGEDKIEKRAAEIFARLGYLSHTCIVFDEFDEMVMVRTPNQGWKRSGLTLLTPTMLPLLSELRKRAAQQCCVVSFTTNYLSAIDHAARRGGRVDERILMVYPDYPSRLLMALVVHSKLRSRALAPLITRALNETAWCTYGDVVTHIEQVLANPKQEGDESAVLGGSKDRKPNIAVDAAYYSPILNDPEAHMDLLKYEIERLIDAAGIKEGTPRTEIKDEIARLREMLGRLDKPTQLR